KRIPVAAGLAGGSADAAAALVACNELWRTGLSQAELCELAAGVGSDVAFGLVGGTAIGVGRGERVTPALAAGTYHWVLAFATGMEHGALAAIVSGSGPTCAYLAKDARHAADLAVTLAGAGVCRTVVHVLGPVPGASVTGTAPAPM